MKFALKLLGFGALLFFFASPALAQTPDNIIMTEAGVPGRRPSG